MIDNRKIKTSTKITVPFIFIVIILSIISSNSTELLLEKYIKNFYIQTLDTTTEKTYFLIKNDYKNLFYNYGKDIKKFHLMQEALKNETLKQLKMKSKKADYHSFIIDDDHIIPISGNITEFSQVRKLLKDKNESQNYFISDTKFIPWKWHIVIFKNKKEYYELIKKNKNLIFFEMFVMTLIVILTLMFILKVFLQNQIHTILDILKEISKGKYKTIHIPNFFTSYEIAMLTDGLNKMIKKTHKKQKQLETSKNYARTLLDSQTSIIFVSDGEKLIDANKEFFKLFKEYGSAKEFKTNECICKFFTKIDDKKYINDGTNWINHITIDKDISHKVNLKYKDIEKIFSVQVKSIKDKKLFVVTMNDITDLENYKNELYFNLYHNNLTKLPNRRSLVEDIQKHQIKKTLMIIDLDALKEINDFYGHNIGDLVIQTISNRLVNISRTNENLYLNENRFLQELQKNSKIYHLGGDEFAILIFCHREYEQADVEKLANIYLNKIQNQLIEVQNHTFPIRASIGISISKDNLFTQADMALKKAKKNNKDVVFYDKNFKMLEKYKENLQWIQKLEEAIREDRIICVYQPLYHNKTKQIQKYETLVRIKEKDGCLISPFFFLEVAKKAKLYSHITKTVITKSFEHFKDCECSFSINISLEDIQDIHTKDFILDALSTFQDPKRVVFEILESQEIQEYEEVNTFIKEIKKYGAKIAIDDFGTGYSNFAYILNLDADILKIDGSLIKNLDTDANSKAIVKTIVNFCTNANLEIVAEFVDKEEIFNEVVNMGIDYTQGYYISQPKEGVSFSC